MSYWIGTLLIYGGFFSLGVAVVALTITPMLPRRFRMAGNVPLVQDDPSRLDDGGNSVRISPAAALMGWRLFKLPCTILFIELGTYLAQWSVVDWPLRLALYVAVGSLMAWAVFKWK